MARKFTARTQAARVLADVLAGKSLSEALPHRAGKLGAEQRPLLQELAYGSLRWYLRLRAQADSLLKKPLKAKDRDIDSLVIIGLYQLQYLRIPDHAAVAETVEAARGLGKQWAAAMVNGVLRNFQRRREALAALDEQAPVRTAHPEWLLQRLQAAWPADVERIIEVANTQAPMSLRVNTRRLSRDEYLARLQAGGIEATASPHSAVGIVLAQATDVSQLPGFAEGDVSVQDIAAQQAALLLDPAPGQRVLDACAAPGGKTLHLLEHGADDVAALDVSEARLEKISENLFRSGLQAQVLAGDAAQPDSWWDGRPFDRILLDAPCSATGVIRRHPDIKLLRRDEDINSLVATQRQILDALWPLLASGGMLLYATCSILPDENSEQVQAFLARHEDARLQTLQPAWGRDVTPGWQILPGDGEADGFFYALLCKNP
jgi:16S rRNA (cytosine967-C5)-methyltransferase